MISTKPVTKNKVVLNGSGINIEALIGSGLKNKTMRMIAQKTQA